MTHAVLDDHLLRDLLADDIQGELGALVASHGLATTNLFYLRLCKSVVTARGGQLTGRWPLEQRHALGRLLVSLPGTVVVVPMQTLAFRMAQLAGGHRVSSLGAEAVAAAEHLGGPLCVWAGDDGPGTRACAAATRVTYTTVSR